MSLTQEIKQRATELGFDVVGITGVLPIDTEQKNYFLKWLHRGYAGQMTYLHRNLDKRLNPAMLLENAQSVICIALNYKPPLCTGSSPASQAEQPRPTCTSAPMGKVATYAQYQDYHPFIKKQLHKLTDFINSITDRHYKFKICVDSAPLAERALAARAGLGFIGKNHMLINPTLGPQILLGEIITTLKLPADKPITSNCANCNKCVDACPTAALSPTGQFDAHRCISYLTIEYKGQIPPDLAKKITDRLFGCDECVLACPYQQNAPPRQNKHFKFYPDRGKLNLYKILQMTEHQFQTQFADSVLLRTGLQKLKTNAHLCLKNIT